MGASMTTQDNPLFAGYRPNTFQGMDVVIHDDLVRVRRTWRERLLSWPWRPFAPWKFVQNAVVQPGEVFQAGGKLIMLRSTWQELQKQTG